MEEEENQPVIEEWTTAKRSQSVDVADKDEEVDISHNKDEKGANIKAVNNNAKNAETPKNSKNDCGVCDAESQEKSPSESQDGGHERSDKDEGDDCSQEKSPSESQDGGHERSNKYQGDECSNNNIWGGLYGCVNA